MSVIATSPMALAHRSRRGAAIGSRGASAAAAAPTKRRGSRTGRRGRVMRAAGLALRR
jgi:hypothetical protein